MACNATVLDVSSSSVRIRFDSVAACARCAAGEGCGAGLLGWRRGGSRLSVPRSRLPDARPGDRFRVLVPASSEARLAIVLFGTPLVVFVVIALVGALVRIPVPIVGLLALVTAWAVLAACLRRMPLPDLVLDRRANRAADP